MNVVKRSKAVARVGLVGIFGLGGLVAVSCGSTKSSSSSPTSTASTTAAAPSSSSSFVAQAAAQLAQYSGPAVWTAPGSAFDTAKARGKSVWFIPNFLSNDPTLDAVAAGMKLALGKVGVTLRVCDGQAEPTQYTACMGEAIAANAGVIVFGAIPTSVIAPQIAKANADHIPLVELADSNSTSTPAPGVQAVVSFNYSLGGELEADWITVTSKGKASVFAPNNIDVGATAAAILANGSEPRLKALCPSCTVLVKSVAAADWSTQLGSLTSSTLQTNPSVDYVIAQYDDMYVYMGPAIKQAGLAKKVQVVSFNGSLQPMQSLAEGSSLKMDVGSDNQSLGYAAADQALRLITGVAPSKDEDAPLRVFTQTTAKTLALNATAANSGAWYGTEDVLPKFLALWGVHP